MCLHSLPVDIPLQEWGYFFLLRQNDKKVITQLKLGAIAQSKNYSYLFCRGML